MPYIHENNQSELFRKTIEEQLIGPGSDIFGFDPQEELISTSPRHNYYAGILFSPAFHISGIVTDPDDDGKEQGDEDIIVTEEKIDNENYQDQGDKPLPETEPQKILSNIYVPVYPTYCGLTFCVRDDVEKIDVEVTYGKYSLSTERKIKLSQAEYDLIISKIHDIEEDNELIRMFGEKFISSRMAFSDEILTMENPLPVYRFSENGKAKQKTLLNSEFKQKSAILFGNNQIELQKLFRLLGNIYVRKPNKIEREIYLNEDKGVIAENETEYLVKQMKRGTGDKKFIRLQIRNVINSQEKRYQDCLFQIKLTVKNVELQPYHEQLISSVDEDFNVIEYQYRNEIVYGKGSNCAAAWEKSRNHSWIETTHLPQADIRSYSNDAREGDPNTQVYALHNLSVWSDWDDDLYLEKLRNFADGYKKWIDEDQVPSIQNEPEEQRLIGQSLIDRQLAEYDRLIRNIEFLGRDKNKKEGNVPLNCFKLANTAMMLQMIVARDKRFEKNRSQNEVGSDNFRDFKNLRFFREYAASNPGLEPKYRPFQLAFLLMNVESSFNIQSEDRTGIVDLIWFPTGGGKTEAYLALTALAILKRRMENPEDDTTAVIMRYTLRLLTAQQFERATYLICALEFLRGNTGELNINNLNLGKNKITIGMWVGSSTTPNRLIELEENSLFADFFENPSEAKNRFPITYCPWCGTKLTPEESNSVYGYIKTRDSLRLICHNEYCFFHGQNENILPVAFIDEQLYSSPPSLLFATVDKMVQLSHKNEAGVFFNQQSPPELVIQDELHLLTGPLGSLSGLYETLIDILCTTEERKPKIIASTATTRNTASLIKLMYGRELNIFPPQGVRYNDNYFSYVEDKSRRSHIGLIPAGKPSVTAEIKLVETIYLAKAKLLQEFIGDREIIIALEDQEGIKKGVDPYWTLVLYYNSLRDLGRSNSRVTQEFKERIRGKYLSEGLNGTFEFIHAIIFSRSVEFTSRQDSTKIKALLSRTSKPVSFNLKDGKISEDNECIDLALASNMFSVGIDVDRLNLMVVMGQPGMVSEYIQASSRVGRKSKGLVINLYSSMRTREMSFYENFTGFHNGYYKHVEPLSITPFTEVAAEKILNAVLVGYVRQKLNLRPEGFLIGHARSLFSLIEGRIPEQAQRDFIESKLLSLADIWIQLIGNGNASNYRQLMENADFELMNSLRDIDPDLYIMNSDLDYKPNY